MIKLAKIVQIDSNHVTLKLEKKVQCFDCKSRCSDGFLSFLFSKNKEGILSVGLNPKVAINSHLEDENNFFTLQHKPNDIVGLNFEETEMFKMGIILYGLPILIFIILLFVGYFSFQLLQINADLGGIFGLISGLFLSKLIIKSLQSKLKPKVKFFK